MRTLLFSAAFLLLCAAGENAGTDGEYTCMIGWSLMRKKNGDASCVRLQGGARRSSWWEAEHHCRQLGLSSAIGFRTAAGHLLQLGSMEDQRAAMLTLANVNAGLHGLTQSEDWEKMFGRRLPPPFLTESIIGKDLWIGLGQRCPKEFHRELKRTEPKLVLKWTDQRTDPSASYRPFNSSASNDSLTTYCAYWRFQNNSQPGVIGQSWALSNCSEARNYICELPARRENETSIREPAAPKRRTRAEIECGDESWCYLKSSKSCYKFLTDDVGSYQNFWFHAKEACTVAGADLVSIHSQVEQDFIEELAQMTPQRGQDDVWIGLNKLNRNGALQWSDGTPFDFPAPVMRNDNGSCYSMSTDTLKSPSFQRRWGRYQIRIPTSVKDQDKVVWQLERCDQRRPALCKKYASSHEEYNVDKSKDTQKAGGCEKGWVYYRRKCYKFSYLNENATKSEAHDKCKDEKGNLISISDQYEYGFIMSQLENRTKGIWLGMEVNQGRFRWEDETPITFTNFDAFSPILRIGGHAHPPGPSSSSFISHQWRVSGQNMCVSMSQDGSWSYKIRSTTASSSSDMEDCDKVKMGFICEGHTDTSKTAETPKIGNCPEPKDGNSTVVQFRGDCYIFKKAAKAWKDAREDCEKVSGAFSRKNLVSVGDTYEWSFLYSRAKEIFKLENFWIGLHEDISTYAEFKWADESEVALTPWGLLEPQADPALKCVASRLGSRSPDWIMHQCDFLLPYVCKLSNSPVEKAKVPNGTCGDEESEGRKWIPVAEEGKCYLVNTDTAPGYIADMECMTSKDAKLASFTTMKSIEALTKSKKLTFASGYWIGLIKKEDGSYMWTDSSPLRVTNWATGYPLRRTGVGSAVCISIDKNGLWRDGNCWQQKAYVCSKKMKEKPETTTTTTTTTMTTAPAATAKGTTPSKKGSTAAPPPTPKTEDEKPTKSPPKAEKSDKAPPTPTPRKDGGGSSSGAIIGIVFSVIFFVLLAVVVLVVARRRGFRLPWSGRDRGFMHFDTLQQADMEDF